MITDGTCRFKFFPPDFPEIVCLCGSTRFMDEFRRQNSRLTLEGKIVLSVGCDTKADWEENAEAKIAVDALHKRKIDLSDRVFIINPGGYIGASTASEIAYARQCGRPISWLEQPVGEPVEPALAVRPADPLVVSAAVAVLNEAMDLDKSAIDTLMFARRVNCNEALAKHPNIQVRAEETGYSVGPLGLINGILERAGAARVAAVIESDGTCSKFARYIPSS